jgi:hypothetical protein
MAQKKGNGKKKAEESENAQEQQNAPAAPQAVRPGNRPVASFKLGRIRVSIWRNHSPQHGVWYSFTFSRTYKDPKTNEYRNATSFGMDDLLAIGEVARQARWWVEDEQARQRELAAQGAQAAEGKGDAFEPPASGNGATSEAASQDIPF